MICEKILGKISDFPQKKTDYLTIEWHEVYKRLHKKTSRAGRELAVRLDDEILTRGLQQDDVLGVEGDTLVAVDIPACDMLVIHVDENHPRMAEKLCWEIGNKHAPLFWGDNPGEFLTPYDMPLESLVKKLHGVTVMRENRKPDFSRVISGAGHNYSHTHTHSHEPHEEP
jgi:urease accessory protein